MDSPRAKQTPRNRGICNPLGGLWIWRANSHTRRYPDLMMAHGCGFMQGIAEPIGRPTNLRNHGFRHDGEIVLAHD